LSEGERKLDSELGFRKNFSFNVVVSGPVRYLKKIKLVFVSDHLYSHLSIYDDPFNSNQKRTI